MPNITCTIDGCDRKFLARGLCAGHYRRWSLNGESFDRAPLRYLPPKGTPCSLDECTRLVYAKGLCNPHWQRQYLTGSIGEKPLIFRLKQGVTLSESVAHYSKAKPTPRGCVEWTGPRHETGYGLAATGGRVHIASRAVYELAFGPIPKGLVVRHACDNPPCVNIAHLSIGTHGDNHSDMVSRDRHTRGERSGTAKLTDLEVLEVRRRAAAGDTHASIASTYNLSRRHIGDIVNRVCWKHI